MNHLPIYFVISLPVYKASWSQHFQPVFSPKSEVIKDFQNDLIPPNLTIVIEIPVAIRDKPRVLTRFTYPIEAIIVNKKTKQAVWFLKKMGTTYANVNKWPSLIPYGFREKAHL